MRPMPCQGLRVSPPGGTGLGAGGAIGRRSARIAAGIQAALTAQALGVGRRQRGRAVVGRAVAPPRAHEIHRPHVWPACAGRLAPHRVATYVVVMDHSANRPAALDLSPLCGTRMARHAAGTRRAPRIVR
jgi:hypothetical protein